MKNWFVSIFFLVFFQFSSIACCAEYNERYVPLGQTDESLYMLEIKFHRNCRGKGGPGISPDNYFYMSGIVNILKYEADGFILVDSLIHFEEIECQCTYENYVDQTNSDSLFNSYYEIALKKMEQEQSFQKAVQKRIRFNDSTNYSLIETDTAVWLSNKTGRNYYYEEEINIWENISTQEPSFIAEQRIYRTKDYNIEVIQLSSKYLSVQTQETIKDNFSKNNPFWPHDSLWHGVRRDVVYLFK
jgi:hypothetical protein